MSPDELEVAWERWEQTRSLEVRNDLLVHYARSLVRPIALRMAKGVTHVSNDVGQDFISFGVFGLIDAMERYDRSRGRFETFAGPRIRGAILDELRALDWVPRGMRSVAREIEKVEEALINELGRQPSQKEIEAVVGAKSRQSIVKLQLQESDPPESGTTVDHGQDMESSVAVADVVDRAADAVASLEPRLRAVAVLVYVEGQTLTKVGEILGVSESRVCQLQGQFLKDFGKALAG